jgi:hypothetical protein
LRGRWRRSGGVWGRPLRGEMGNWSISTSLTQPATKRGPSWRPSRKSASTTCQSQCPWSPFAPTSLRNLLALQKKLPKIAQAFSRLPSRPSSSKSSKSPATKMPSNSSKTTTTAKAPWPVNPRSPWSLPKRTSLCLKTCRLSLRSSRLKTGR